jgi:hypothetical protein
MNTTAYEQRILRAVREEWRCPVCALLEQEEFDLLADLQYSVTSDEQMRQAIAHEGGFCDYHFRQFSKIANIASSAMLLLALVDVHSSATTPVQVKCRICERLSSLEDTFVRGVVDLFASDAFREMYERACGLCLAHRSAVELLQNATALTSWLNDVQRKQIQSFLPVLQVLSSRSYFETSNTERRSIAQLVEKFVGRRAVGA